MNKKELTETIKIIYDALSEGKDSVEEIKNLKDKLEKRDFSIKSYDSCVQSYCEIFTILI